VESRRFVCVVGIAFAAACSDPVQPLQTAPPGVVFTYPVDAQVDVPQGTRIVVTFSDPVEATALGPCSGSGTSVTGAFCLVGPNGVVDTPATVAGDDGKTVQFAAPPLDEGGAYTVYVKSDLAPTATNLPGGPLFHFKVRSTKPKSFAPVLLAVNGGDPASPESFRPMLESSTIRLLFSEPLDPRTVTLAAGAFELVDGTGAAVPASIVTDGIHVSIDPKTDLVAGTTYTVKVGTNVTDLSGQPVTAATSKLSPHDSRAGKPAIAQVLRTRQAGDPGATSGRTGAKPNVIAIDKPLIGTQASSVKPSSLATELGDPKVLGGPIAFTIRKGQRLKASGLDVKLGGAIPSGLTTGDIEIELLTDGGGRLYRNPWQAADQRPENDRAPLYADLSMDVAVYAVDPTGNAVLAQTVLGLQGVGLVQATDGVLDIETVASMELGLLGVTRAPTNMVLELITDTTTTVPPDTTAPTLVATYPGQNVHDLPVDHGVELIFDEPIDLDRARAGGVVLQNAAGAPVPSVIESHGSAIVVRPLARLTRNTTYKVVMPDVADVAGNKLATASPLNFSTENVVNTGSPMAVTALHPGVGCALTGATATSPGRCTSGAGSDDLYKPFTLPGDEPIEATFNQPPVATSVVLGTVCNSGSVRVEELDAGGACSAVVKGTLIIHDRSIAFTPDTPWIEGKKYRLTLISGNNASCAAGELCGISDAASFDVLNSMDGNGASGGPDLIANFVGAKPTGATYLVAETGPLTDLNGNGTVDGSEVPDDDNRAALRISGTGGLVSSATFTGPDCLPATPANEGCIYLAGALPAEMQPLQMGCTLPGGASAASCIPVTLTPQIMYATSVAMDASAVITISTETKTSIMRVREPASGPVTGYIYDDNGVPTMVVSLDLYMDAPDMSITLSSHDLHSKPLSATLKGPVTFLPDGRIAIAISNVADVPVRINISTPLGGANVDLVVPTGEMKLKLLSRPLRGVAP